MIYYPNAKVNLGLRVLGVREDGYHNISTVMIPVALYDIMEIQEGVRSEISYSGLAVEKKELVALMYNWLREQQLIPELSIHLHKNIPIGAGLGGGSSDLACLTRHCFKYLKDEINKEKLLMKMKELSTDSTFFLKNEPSFVTGKGDVLDPFPHIEKLLDGRWITLHFIGPSQSTAQAYHMLQVVPGQKPFEANNFKDFNRMRETVGNDFDPQQKSEVLYEGGIHFAAMTGTGNGFYSISDDPVNERSIQLDFNSLKPVIE